MANKKISDYTAETSPSSGDLHLIQSGSSYKKVDHDNLLENLTTDDLTEGVSASRKYFSDELAQDAVGSMIASGTDGVVLTYNDGANTLTPGLNSNYELIQTYTKVFDQTEIIALNSTPIAFEIPTLANKCLIPIAAFAFFDNQATTPFTNGDLIIRDRTSTDAIFEMSNAFLNTSADKYGMFTKPTLEAELTVNTDLQLFSDTSNPTGGGSGNRVVIQIKYMYSPDVTVI